MRKGFINTLVYYYDLFEWEFLTLIENITFWYEEIIGRENLKEACWKLGETVTPAISKYMYYKDTVPELVQDWLWDLCDALNWIVLRPHTRTKINARLLSHWLDESILSQKAMEHARNYGRRDNLEPEQGKPIEKTDFKTFRRLMMVVCNLVIEHKYNLKGTKITIEELQNALK